MTNELDKAEMPSEWEQFEKWAADNHSIIKKSGKDYIDYMWAVWQARAAYQANAKPKEAEQKCVGDVEGHTLGKVLEANKQFAEHKIILLEKIAQQAAELEALRGALEFYSKRERWIVSPLSPAPQIVSDKGETAREALATTGKE